MNCRFSSQLLSEARDRKLTTAERDAVKRHLDTCPACWRCKRQFKALCLALRSLVER